jgi:hypothetical protein
LNLYGPYRDQEELEKDLIGTARSGRLTGRFPKSARSARSQRTIDRKPSNGSMTPMESDSEEEPPYYTDDLDDDVDVAFDIQRLPEAYGTKTTETIIEALFNPVKVTDMQYENPFTIYEPVTEPGFVIETTEKSINIGLGLSGTLDHHHHHHHHHNASISKRQNSDASSSFYHYSTGSSSTSLHTTTTSSSKDKSKDSGSGGHGSVPEAHVGGDLTATATTSTFGGVRGWWKRRTTRPETPPITARV